ncbi:head decoration protein [Brucella sp. TWI432]
MAKVFTEGRHAAEFILEELGVSFSRDSITIPAGTGVIEPGTVLGKLKATGKFVPSPVAQAVPAEGEDPNDGSENASAINIYRVDATDVDVMVAAIVRGSAVNGKIITYDASVADDAAITAKNAQLADVGIIVR